jgi:hypothetical protein
VKRLVVPLVIIALLLAAGGSTAYAISLGQRVAGLEAELAKRPPANVNLVVGKTVKPTSAQDCVRYTVSGDRVEESCVLGGTGSSTCYADAAVGRPLPATCR